MWLMEAIYNITFKRIHGSIRRLPIAYKNIRSYVFVGNGKYWFGLKGKEGDSSLFIRLVPY